MEVNHWETLFLIDFLFSTKWNGRRFKFQNAKTNEKKKWTRRTRKWVEWNTIAHKTNQYVRFVPFKMAQSRRVARTVPTISLLSSVPPLAWYSYCGIRKMCFHWLFSLQPLGRCCSNCNVRLVSLNVWQRIDIFNYTTPITPIKHSHTHTQQAVRSIFSVLLLSFVLRRRRRLLLLISRFPFAQLFSLIEIMLFKRFSLRVLFLFPRLCSHRSSDSHIFFRARKYSKCTARRSFCVFLLLFEVNLPYTYFLRCRFLMYSPRSTLCARCTRTLRSQPIPFDLNCTRQAVFHVVEWLSSLHIFPKKMNANEDDTQMKLDESEWEQLILQLLVEVFFILLGARIVVSFYVNAIK